MKRIYHFFLVLLILCCTQILFAQNNVDMLFTSVSEGLAGHPSELVYLQTNKGIYETGEDLWFKAYGLDAQSFGLSDRSKTLYLQMMDAKDSVVWREKYPIENGIADGHVYMDEKLVEGNFSLEAYTRHSFFNDTTEMLAARNIKVVKNIAHDSGQAEKRKKRELRFDLFPEGGNLVAGLPSRLAFKATDGNGYPVDVEGTLYIDENPATTFKSSHDGMGFLSFTPSVGRNYRIELKDGKSYSLPEIYSQGMSFQLLKHNKEWMEFVISQTEGVPEQDVYLLGQMRGVVCCVVKGKLKNSLRIKIPAMEFPYQGIAEFTLFDGTMQPIAERLVYVHPEKRLNISIKLDKDNYVLREKATLKIKVTDDGGKPIQANLGISVFDKIYVNPADPANILTHCYLTSQIRGIIHNPAYYFNEENKDRMEAMDLLLLTQGWRRYVWRFGRSPYHGGIFLTDEISGTQTVKSKKKSKETQSTEQLIQVSGAEGKSAFVWADSTGCFKVGTNMMKEIRGGYVYLKPMLSKEFKPKLEITDYFPLIDSIRKNKPFCYPIMDLSQAIKQQVLDMPVVSNDSTILLDEVVVTRKARKPFRDKFMGRLDSLAQANLGSAYVCGCGYLQNYKPGYDAHPYWKPCSISADKRSKPIEGEKYYIVKFKHLGGNAFSVEDEQLVTYHGETYSEEELLHMNNLYRTKGYYAAREFYQPDEIDMQLSTPDARNTLLWQPSIDTDEKGEATISFYCSDINTEFIGVVEGTDGAGLLGTGKCEFRVVRNITN